jgi:hypothetical protein
MQTWICTPPKDPSTGSPFCVRVHLSPGQKPPRPTHGKYICQGLSVDDCWPKDLSTVGTKPGSAAATDPDNTASKNLTGAYPGGPAQFGGSSGTADEKTPRNHPRVERR